MSGSKWLVSTLFLTAGSIMISGCGNSDNSLQVGEQSRSESIDVTAGPLNVYSDLVLPSIEPEVGALLPANGSETALFSNTGFENDFAGWSSCKGGNGSGITVTTDAYQGAKAIQVSPDNCFYRSAVVMPGDDLLLSCVAKLSDTAKWSALGLGFGDENWTTVSEAPASLISSSDYTTYSVRATVPPGVSYASMWLFSESSATVDNCTLLLLNGEQNPVVPLDNSDNLLENSAFAANENNAPYNWYVGCDTTGKAEVSADSELQLSDNACVAQSLSNEDLDILRGNFFIFECAAYKTSAQQYADIVIGFDGKESTVSTLTEGKFQFTGKAPDTLTNGFVGMYSELTGGNYVGFSDCYLSVMPDPDAEIIPLPDEPDPDNPEPTDPESQWPQPRDLDGDPSLAEVYYVPELDLSWLRMSAAGRDQDFGIEDFRGLVEGDSVNAFMAAMNAANYLGFSDWRLPHGHGQATVNCEIQGDTTLPECYLEAGFMNQKVQEIHGGIAAGPFAYWPRRSRWVGSTLSTDIQYYFEFDMNPEDALRYCGQQGLDQVEACESKFVWIVHDGDIGTPIE